MRFSVIVPTYRRPKQLLRCLAAVSALRFRADDMEVIVLDDAGGTEMATVLDGVVPCRLRYRPAKRRTGPAGARNAAAGEANGTYLAFLDDDCIPDPGWLEAFDAAIRSEPDEPILFGGRNTHHGDGPYTRASQLLLDHLTTYLNRDVMDPTFFPSNNMVLRRADFILLGGFDTGFPLAAGEDRDFCERWRARGFRLMSVPAAKVAHEHRSSWSQYVGQHMGYGRGLAQLNRRRDERESPVPRLQSPGFYSGLLTAGLRSGSIATRLNTTALLVVSQVATLVGYLRERNAPPILPTSTATEPPPLPADKSPADE